jgi:branched-chain amino acid transport system substrate-binding protein
VKFFACIVIIISFLLQTRLSYGNAFRDEKPSNININIAVVVPASGRFSYFGKQFIHGLFLSVGKAGDPRIKYRIINLPVNANSAKIDSIFSHLAKNKISAVIGPIFAGQLKFFASNAVKYKIPVITPSPLFNGKNPMPMVFSYGMTLKQEIRTEMRYAHYDNISSVSVIYPDSGYGLKLLSYINRYSKKYGIAILGDTSYSANTVDFFYNFNSIVEFNSSKNGHLTKAEEAELGITPYDLMHGITKSKPDIPFGGLFVLGGLSKLKLILTQLMYYNISGFPIFGLSALNSRPFIEKYGFYMQNAIFPDGFFKHAQNKTVKKFNSAYKKNYGEMPNILSAEGYDIGGIIIKAASEIKPKNNASISASEGNELRFYNAVLKIKSFKGVCGRSKLKGDRFKKKLYLFKYKDNKIYVLENPF